MNITKFIKKITMSTMSNEKALEIIIRNIDDLESFVLYSDIFNDVNSQVVEVEDIPKIIENFREVLKQGRQRRDSTAEQSAFQQ